VSISAIPIESREHLLAWLGEAAEIEHNLMCCYLYAQFSLKRSTDEGLTEAELAAVNRWRGVLRGIALEEMVHLTLVSNLIAAIGGTPHLQRPNLPASPGAYPAGVVIELAPFDLATLDHFVFLERPQAAPVADGANFRSERAYQRTAAAGRLMPNAADYDTVGDLYRAIEQAVERLAQSLGEDHLFSGDRSLQIGAADSALPGLIAVTDLASARRALDTIVVQGEGSEGGESSHFARFCAVRHEYAKLLEANPGFAPARPAARNPVMRQPPVPEGRVWVVEPHAAQLLDLANALYTHMLRSMMQVYRVPGRALADKRALLSGAIALMRAMTPVAERLTLLPADPARPGVHAGMSFAMIRNLGAVPSGPGELEILQGRTDEMLVALEALAQDDAALQPAVHAAREAAACFARVRPVQRGLVAVPAAPAAAAAPAPATGATQAPMAVAGLPVGAGIEQAKGRDVSISFDSGRCIHARFCVTGLPKVFLANTPGTWLFPDEADAEELTAIARACPSGAIRYLRHDGGENEAPPQVNLIHLRENGPLAVRATLVLRGAADGLRATLCRCGQSKRKPYCDGSHHDAGFVASGEPETIDATPLDARGGVLEVQPQPNGPLQLHGPVEICSGTGRVLLRTTDVALCRCGQSKHKPLCDGSHAAAGFVAA